jgi:hypothetical protein
LVANEPLKTERRRGPNIRSALLVSSHTNRNRDEEQKVFKVSLHSRIPPRKCGTAIFNCTSSADTKTPLNMTPYSSQSEPLFSYREYPAASAVALGIGLYDSSPETPAATVFKVIETRGRGKLL